MNPFPHDIDRAAIWTMLMLRDFEAFATRNWSLVQDDFDTERFLGIHAHFSAHPNDWKPAFPALESYRDEWLRQAAVSAETDYAEPLVPALLRAVRLDHIVINDDVATAHKIFNGTIALGDGRQETLAWQTLYFCRHKADRWLITGFIGYLPLDMGPR